MSLSEYLPSNNLFILIAFLVVAIVAFAWYLRKPRNRHPMDTPRGHAIDEARTRDVEEARRRS